MTISELLSSASLLLQPTRITCAADRDLGRLEAEILLGFVLKKEKTWLLIHQDDKVSTANTKTFRGLVARRQKQEPIAYLTHEREFYGRSFSVNKHVLIPRPETELMIERMNELEPKNFIVWDVGTGSGAIAVTLAKEMPQATILATDVSALTLKKAKDNAKKHLVSDHITFLKSNLLQPAAYRWLKRHAAPTTVRHYDRTSLLIAANLPYLPISDKRKLSLDVVKYEPSSALFSGTDGLTLIKKFLGQLSRHLPEWGYQTVTILIEFDPPQKKTLAALAKKLFPNAGVSIHKDLADRDRLLEIKVG